MRNKILILFIFVCSIFLLFASFYFRPELGDEGILAMDGWRVWKGEIPHRDFFQFIPPLAAYVQASVFKLFSPSIFAVRLLGFLYGIIIFILTYFFYKKFIKSEIVVATALSFIIPFGVGSWFFGSHHWLVAILQIGGGIAFIYALEKKSKLWTIISGIFFGSAIFTLQDQGGYLVLGLIFCAFFVSKKEKNFFLISAASAIVSFLFLSLPLVLASSFKEIFWQWVDFPLFQYKGAQGNQFSISNYFQQIVSSWSIEAIKVSPLYALSSSISSTFQCLTPILSIGSLLFLWLRERFNKAKLIFISIISVSFLLGAFHRLAMTNLAWAFVSLLPFYIVLDRLIEKREGKLKFFAYVFAIFFIISNVVFSFSRSFHCLRTGDSFIVNSSAGKYRFFNPYKAHSLSGLIEAIEKNVPPEEPMFCVGYIPLVNFMTKHPNPTPFNFMLVGKYYSEKQISLWVLSVETKKVKWGITAKENLDEQKGKILLANYNVKYSNENYVLWERKN